MRPRRRRLRGDRRLALRQHDQRLPGRVRARARRPGQPGARSRTASPTRRSCSAPTSCRPASRRRSAAASASATRSPSSRRARSACARPRARAWRARRWSSASTASRSGSSSRARMGADVVLDFKRAGRRRRDQAADRRRRRRRHRGARHSRPTFENAPAQRPARRHAVEPRRLFGPPAGPARCVRGGARRPHDRHVALPGRQGADAPADERRRREARSRSASWSRTRSGWPTSRRRTTCSPTSATAS